MKKLPSKYQIGDTVRVKNLIEGEEIEAVVEAVEYRIKQGTREDNSFCYLFYHLKVFGDKYSFKKLMTEEGNIIESRHTKSIIHIPRRSITHESQRNLTA